MVSLDNTRNPKGGFSFETTSPTNDDFIETISNGVGSLAAHVDTMPLTAEIEPNFKQIATTYVAVGHILSLLILETVVFLAPYLCEGDGQQGCWQFSGYEVAVFFHAGFWLPMFIFDRYYHREHMRSRRNGYLEFYRQTRVLRALPLIFFSVGNSLLVVMIQLLNRFCPVTCSPTIDLQPKNYLQIVTSIEIALIGLVLVRYLILIVKFNRLKLSPDISKEMDRPIFLPSQLKDVGYKDSTYISNILENQADMIRFLQERNNKLSYKLNQFSDPTSSLSNIN